MLTPTDREFLRSGGDYYEGKTARQSRYERRRDIRRRLVTSLLDFQTVNAYLSHEQRRQVFGQPTENGADDDGQFQASLQAMLEWVYLGCREHGRDFDSLLESAVSAAEEDYQRIHGGEIVDVAVKMDVEVTARYEGVEELGRRLEEGEPLTARSIYKMPMIGRIPVDPEKVDVVRIVPEGAQMREESEAAIVETILKEHLGIDADVEVVGTVDLPDDVKDIMTEEDAAVPPEEYQGGVVDDSDT